MTFPASATRLTEREAGNAHSAYNAMIRRLVSFERAMEALHPAG